jgi:hypothetical protein
MQVSHGVNQVFRRSDKATETLFAMGGGQMLRQVGP